MIRTQNTWTDETKNEAEAYNALLKYVNEQNEKGYTIMKSVVDYKVKKDKKSGDVIDETWVITVKTSYTI